MILRTFVLIALCCAFLQPHTARADGPLRRLLGGGAGQSQDSDGYGSYFNSLSCAKMAKLAGNRIGRSSSQPNATWQASYGAHPAQALDVYAPPEKQNAPMPVIIMVHGGAWCVGDKDAGKVIVNKTGRWLPKGFLFISVNYRMLPDNADVLTQAGDVATAIAYVEAHAADWGGNPSKIIVMGHSAGAHLVSLLSSDQKLAAKYGAKPWLGTVSLDSGALNVGDIMRKQHPVFYDDAFGKDPAYWDATSPTLQLSKSSLPWLGVCSSQRKISCPEAHTYSGDAGKFGVKAGVLEEDLKHGEINEYLGEDNDYTKQVELFMGSLDPDVKARLALSPANIIEAVQSVNGWTGRYMYEYDGGTTVPGIHAVVEYDLTINDKGDPVCTLSMEGYQTDEQIICTVSETPEEAVIAFKNYEDGKTTNIYGKAPYNAGEPLFILKRNGKTLSTEWQHLSPDPEQALKPGHYFNADKGR